MSSQANETGPLFPLCTAKYYSSRHQNGANCIHYASLETYRSRSKNVLGHCYFPHLLTCSDHLKENGSLRDDIPIEYDETEQPTSWADLRDKVKSTLHPQLEQKATSPVAENQPSDK